MSHLNEPKTKILIVEDEESIREGLVDVFVYRGYEVEAVGEGNSGLEKALSGRYHLILLDIMLPGLDGLSVCERIRQADRFQPLILLTAKGNKEDIVRGLKAGADDYVAKPFSLGELMARVEAVLRRSTRWAVEKEKICWGMLEIDPKNLEICLAGRRIEVTRREVDILRYLIRHRHRIVSRQEMLKDIWGYSSGLVDTRTVDIHITKLRRKIEEDPQAPIYIVTVRGEGYKMGGGLR